MGKLVKVEIPVTEAAAAALLGDPARAEYVGQFVSSMLVPPRPDIDRMTRLIADLKAETSANGLTDDMIDEELAAYNAERRS